MEFNAEFSIASDHPALPGHFPGHPIVPGVVILDYVVSLLHDRHGDFVRPSFPRVKFLAPVRAGDPIVVKYTMLDERRFRFVCSAPDGKVTEGEIELQ